MSVENPVVFEEGPMATVIHDAIEAAYGLLNNGTFRYVVLDDEVESIHVHSEGRGFVDFSVVDREYTDDSGAKLPCVEISPSNDYRQVDVDGNDFETTAEVDDGAESIELEILGVDMVDLTNTLQFLLQCAVSTGYMMGRKDQLNDSRDNDKQRFVRTKDLPMVTNWASGIEEGMFSSFTDDVSETVELLKKVRGSVFVDAPELQIEGNEENK